MQFQLSTPVRYILLVIFVVGGIYSFLTAKTLYRSGEEYGLYGILTIMSLLGILQNVVRLYIYPAEKNKDR